MFKIYLILFLKIFFGRFQSFLQRGKWGGRMITSGEDSARYSCPHLPSLKPPLNQIHFKVMNSWSSRILIQKNLYHVQHLYDRLPSLEVAFYGFRARESIFWVYFDIKDLEWSCKKPLLIIKSQVAHDTKRKIIRERKHWTTITNSCWTWHRFFGLLFQFQQKWWKVKLHFLHPLWI